MLVAHVFFYRQTSYFILFTYFIIYNICIILISFRFFFIIQALVIVVKKLYSLGVSLIIQMGIRIIDSIKFKMNKKGANDR